MKEDVTPERFRRVGELFDAAVELVPERRAAFLDAECAGDPALRRLVLERLAAHDQAGGFLESPVVSRAAELLAGAAATGSGASSAPTGDDSSSAPTETQGLHGQAAPGGRIGPYFVSRQIGEGGMGEVWLAEQREPIRRKVALKVIKRGLDTKQVVARFDAERQALALMNHPCLARVYDAGSTADGRPYFAMEYVQGLPINEYCDRHRLNVRDRQIGRAHV